MAAAQQIRLLLWKDYLIRKRKLITLIGVLWASAVMMSLYLVRVNIDNQDFPTCQFPARALPSAGVLNFMQSFICSVNNDCEPMDKYDEIPTYEKSKLTQLQRQFSPILYNETVLDVAATVPDALKLMSTLADIVDQPAFIVISKNGLRVKDLFRSPSRVKRYMTTQLELPEEVASDVMESELSFQGILNGGIDRCSPASLSKTVLIEDTDNLNALAKKLCSLSSKDLQKTVTELLLEIDFNKYIKMIGDMYKKLTGDDRMTAIGETITAVLRMLNLPSFLPSELISIFKGVNDEFSYFDITLLTQIMDLFKPTFGDTEAYASIRDFAETTEQAVQFVQRFLSKEVQNNTKGINKDFSKIANGKSTAANIFREATHLIENVVIGDGSSDVFNVLSQLTNFVVKLLPKDTKYDVVLYSTLLSKMIEAAQNVIVINMHIEELAYNVSLGHPEGVKILKELSPAIIGKGFEALADAERTQILTSKIYTPGQMFCDENRVQNFFLISNEEAKGLKTKLCTNAWKNYVADMIKSFGIYSVKDNINKIASILVQSVLGRDISSQLYTIEKDFQVLKNFTETLKNSSSAAKPKINWSPLFGVAEDSELMKVVRDKGKLGKHILIVVHGAFVKEIVKQNPILEYKIAPLLIDITTMVVAINEELNTTDPGLVADLKKHYPNIVQTLLATALNEKKTYKALSAYSVDAMCNGVDTAALYLDFPAKVNKEDIVNTLCNTSRAIESGLQKDKAIGKAIEFIKNPERDPLQQVDWTKMIDSVKQLYTNLDTDYTYLFEFSSYGMDKDTRKRVDAMYKKVKEFWFDPRNLRRSLHLSVKLFLRFFDVLDYEVFGLKGESWLKMKHAISSGAGPLTVFSDVIRLVIGSSKNQFASNLPPLTSEALKVIVPNIPRLIMDEIDIVVRDSPNLSIEPIISIMNAQPPWPCSTTSLSELLPLSPSSKKAVRGLEMLMCMDKPIQEEWAEYLDRKNVSVYMYTNWNTTTFEPHIFLKFSSIFDSLIEDISVGAEAIPPVFNDSEYSRPTLITAWKYAIDSMNNTDKDTVLRNFFKKLDTVLGAIDTSVHNGSLNSIWEEYVKCSNKTIVGDECRGLGRTAWVYTFRSLSVMLENITSDMHTYFSEINESNTSFLQMLGFTRSTGLYKLYDKLPEFIGVLINSYMDYGFMSQVRRASNSQFWDCEAVVSALIAPPDSSITEADIRRLQPFICPSFLYWISLPKGDNTLMDLVAKPQHIFYTMGVRNLTSNYEKAFNNSIDLGKIMTEVNESKQIQKDDLKLNTLKGKLENVVDRIINFNINNTNPSYSSFNAINKKIFASEVYLIRIVAIVNKMIEAIENLKANEMASSEDAVKELEGELSNIVKTFKRRPTETIALHFDILTDVIYKNDENYNIVKALDVVCENLKNNDTSRNILNDNERLKSQICAKKYQVIYGALENVVKDNLEETRHSLLNLLNILQNNNMDKIEDIFKFLNERKNLISSLKKSIKYAYDLGLPLYLKYLQSKLENYNIILSLSSGEDWWKELRALYNGPNSKTFFDLVENSFEATEDFLTNLDKIHLVRLLKDINVNSTDAFCMPNITLSDYVPDRTGLLSQLKKQACATDNKDLVKELPIMVLVSQGYDSDLKLSTEVNYTNLYEDINKIETKLKSLDGGLKAPVKPSWVTDEKLSHLKKVSLSLLSKDTITKISFGLIGNLVDGGTLFLNNSHCTFCSELTTWFKQLNLQLFKKQEYDNLFCHMDTMTMDEIYRSLQTDFHWDMAFKELISTRNYTKYEMNKSINEFLEQVKLHLLDDLSADSAKISQCLAHNVTRNEFGNASLFVAILSHATRLIRSQIPHLREIEGIKNVKYLKKMSAEVAHSLDVVKPLKQYLVANNKLGEELRKVVSDDVANDIEKSDVNLRLLQSQHPAEYIKLSNHKWSDVCKEHNCSDIVNIISTNVNKTLVTADLKKHQEDEFWRFSFISNILQRVEELSGHVSRMLGVASKVDVEGLMDGRLDAMLDLVMQLTIDDVMNSVLYSIQGLSQELNPLLHNSTLDFDIKALANGLSILQQLKNYLLEEDELKVEVSQVFSNADRIEIGLSNLGINNTNFWSIAAPRLQAGHIQLKPLLTSKQEVHIKDFVCQVEQMSQVLIPANLDVVTLDDVYGAVIEQFCGLPDERAKQVLPILVENINFSFVLEKISDILLPKLYAASNLTMEEGSAVLSKYSAMTSLLPVIQDNVGNLTDSLAADPLFASLRNFSSVGALLSSSKFMSSAGNMMCGKPFKSDVSHFYKTIVKSKDHNVEADQEQIDVLPTEFCRSLYKDIIRIEGGKIVWSFVKPLIMGKILYTPANPTVDMIIAQANSTFAHMSKLTGLIHAFARSFSSVDKLAEHREGISVLQRLARSSVFREVKAVLVGDGNIGDVNVNGLFDDTTDLKGIGELLTKASNLLECINLNRFRAVSDEEQLTHEAARLTKLNEFSAGLVFLNSEKESPSFSNVEYKIRMDIENTPTTSRKRNYLWIPGPEANFLENMRYFRGFIQIQDLVDKAIIQLSQNSSRRIQKRETKTEDEAKWAIYTQQMPYPCYRKDFFQTSLYESQALLVCFFFSLLFTVASAVRFIISDKESGNTMLMSVMGVKLYHHTFSWFVSSLAEMVLTCTCITLVLCAGGVLPKSAPSLIFVLMIEFGFSVLCFCYMMSKLFKSASFAAVCSAIAYLITFMPFVMILSLEAVLTSTLKLFVCLSMSSSLCYSFLFISRYEAMGQGAQWSHFWYSPEDAGGMNIAVGAGMMIFDAGLYLLIGWIIDRYFGIRTLQSNITSCITAGEKAGVSIVNITKIYGERSRKPKLALDNVSIELHKGQITTLLGHNGAGKTTLIKILTGMSKPTKGHIIVRSEEASGTRLGVCPQKDVLFESMTAREHVAMYAQLKSGKPLEEVQDEIERMMKVLNLGGVSNELVSRLSGGTRRRLCVALAFVAKPTLVSLDEPTAGVDPAARRDIWSMIVRLKEDRTILLTTHHLDEAELLSDQIVIMHKGQVHTTGSPIEIKRTLGSGYKLTVMYRNKKIPNPEEPWLDDDDEDVTIEERAKQVMAVVRDVVKNANLVDVNDMDIEIGLPFFDANGLNNNYLQLCTALESNQLSLGFQSYNMDCSSLEQVFFNITQQADTPHQGIEYVPDSPDTPSKSASSSSIRTERAPLVSPEGPLKGTAWRQFLALLHARYIHYKRNRWLLFLLLILPSLFVTVAMGFSTIRPPADNERSLPLQANMYEPSTQFLVPEPSIYSKHMDPSFAEQVMYALREEKETRNWTSMDSPTCSCSTMRQQCNITEEHRRLPQMMLLPNVTALNHWLVTTQEVYIEKRYGGFTSALKHNMTQLLVWYNNKGHHAMPSYLNALNSAILKTVAGDHSANITTYTHPLKISKEQISKDTVYQHIADAGIAALLLLAYSLVSAGGAIYAVSGRTSQEKRLQLLCGVSPKLHVAAALTWDMLVMFVNMLVTAVVLEAFGFPVFVARNNLPAICILIMLYGYACGCLVHVVEKFFTEASLANMMLFCANAFSGISGITLLLILDIISNSEFTDNARWILHKVFLVMPQFALGDGLLEIAKNTIQAQVLGRFGIDSYQDPLSTDLIAYHYLYLLAVGTGLLLFNLALEYDCFESILAKFRSESIPMSNGEMEELDVTAERRRVQASLAHNLTPVRLQTIGNINAGFVDTEGKKGSLKLRDTEASDVAQCVDLSKVFTTFTGNKVAVRALTLGIPRGQCTALLGENGAGKSTTFSMLTGQIKPTAGKIYLNGKQVNSRSLCNGLISYCPQSDAIDPLLTVRETLTLYCRLRGITEQQDVIRRAMEMFDLTKYANVQSWTLSGGNKRKLCTAIAFMGRTPLVLLDEPTSGMDPGSRVCVSRGVSSACASSRGVLLSTHALCDARRLAARVALVRASQLRALAPLDHCLRRFGGGHVVTCRVRRGGARAAWRRVRARAPAAVLRVLHHAQLHFLLPTHATVDKKETVTRLSDVFRLMSELQATCDIEDYTVNQSSLDQMFLSFTDKAEVDLEPVDIEPLPSAQAILKEDPDELNSITSL